MLLLRLTLIYVWTKIRLKELTQMTESPGNVHEKIRVLPGKVNMQRLSRIVEHQYLLSLWAMQNPILRVHRKKDSNYAIVI